MKIINLKKTHFMKKTDCGQYLTKFDTIQNVHRNINHILNNGHTKCVDSSPPPLTKRTQNE